MASSKEVIRDALLMKGISKDKDVEELSLSNRKLLDVVDLGRFKYLKHLWLNGNKIRRVNFLHSNFRLCELYLHDNLLSDISGSLRHLTCLVVLTLQNNYLTDLATTVKEFDRMYALRVLNLFNNPVALEPGYRVFVINSLPSLTIFDGLGITKYERDKAHIICRRNSEKVKDTVAFGRRSQGHPCMYSPTRPKIISTRPETPAKSFLKSHPPFENLEEAVQARQMTKSLNVYSMLDWSTVPRSEDKRRSGGHFDLPCFITHVFR
ncbi:unnamed protein product [Candidula unifasciata]|uniref:Leucine rich repeat containing 72 n=1 Tax=Candidula unifasciata TaxID=100452 RepID=A0A8S3YLF4_9EUPU|nr:unnamed protein product [Candidula unifasciata]